MSDEQRPGDPADKAADGAFGGVQSHRSGYGDDKLARLTEWLRAHPTATLASGEGALLLAENDRLRQRAERAERILAALREPSDAMVQIVDNYTYRYGAMTSDDDVRAVVRAVLAQAEQEVGRE